MTDLQVAELWTETTVLRGRVRSLLDSAEDPRCSELAGALSSEPDGVISLVFIGQYNAGKSSLIRALTGTEDVVVDANVATDRVTEIDWRGLRLYDTPGIHAGRPEHDRLTENAIASSDLLIFVITAELFDATIAEYFREIILSRDRGSECLLVVNKSAQDPGDRLTKLAAIAEVLEPLSPDDVPVVFVDAQCKEWADETADGQERAELLQESGFEELVTNIDAFARQTGLRGQLTTPVYETLNVIDEATAILSDDETVRAKIELLTRQRSTIRDHRNELNEHVRHAITETRNRIAALGDELANLVEPGTDPAALQLAVNERAEAAERHADELDQRIESKILETTERLEEALQLGSPLALEFLVGAEGPSATTEPTVDVDLGVHDGEDDVPSDGLRGLKAGLDQTSKFFSEARAGEKGHALVYGVGKKLGVKFRPWGAVKTARVMSRAAAGLAVAANAWELWNDYKQQQRTAEVEESLEKTRLSLRSSFQMLADGVGAQTREAFHNYLSSSYDAALAHVDQLMRSLVTERSAAGDLLEALASHAQQLGALLTQIRGSGGQIEAGGRAPQARASLQSRPGRVTDTTG